MHTSLEIRSLPELISLCPVKTDFTTSLPFLSSPPVRRLQHHIGENMAEVSPSSSQSPPNSTFDTTTNITNLDEDALAHCANHLTLQDISNLAMSSKFLKRVAYSDSVWLRLFRERWPQAAVPSSPRMSGMREAYLARYGAVHKLAFSDPFCYEMYRIFSEIKPVDHIILDKHELIYSQGSTVEVVKIDSILNRQESSHFLNDHKARITCMRLFPLYDTSLFRNATLREENVLVTSSCDHTIRLWWKGSCHRCFRGHNGPVSTLSDKLLGDGSAKILASGGEDGTVRLWSLSSTGKCGQQSLKATLYGHEKPIKLMSVAGHKTCLLATISNDSKVRVWDTTASSASRSSCCVGMTSVPGVPMDMMCHESLLYIAAGSSVVAIDLRTMRKVSTAAICQPKLYSFALLPSKSLICTGGNGKAMIWDIRKNQDTLKQEAVAELDSQAGPVTLLHMDPYKVVSGGPEDKCVTVWEAGTGTRLNVLDCSSGSFNYRADAMAVNGSQIAIASRIERFGVMSFRDFFNANSPVFDFYDDTHSGFEQEEYVSKFWDPKPCNDDSDTESSDGEILL